MTQAKATPNRKSDQPPAVKSDQAKPQDRSVSAPKGEERKGDRPIADVDRKVRGGDA